MIDEIGEKLRCNADASKLSGSDKDILRESFRVAHELMKKQTIPTRGRIAGKREGKE